MQQYLPFTVLKQPAILRQTAQKSIVATVPTVYGIETKRILGLQVKYNLVATVPTVYGIETFHDFGNSRQYIKPWLQQYLPFTVLKPFTKAVKKELIF